MTDRILTNDEIGRWQKACAKVDGCAQVIAQATRTKEAADELIERETILKTAHDATLAAVVSDLGGVPEPPTPGPKVDAEGKPVPGHHSDWIVRTA